MDHFQYKAGKLLCEQVSVQELADTYGTPLYVYSAATLVHHLRQIQLAFKEVDPLICYSVKTNGNLSILQLMREHGAGFDVTSNGELHRALTVGSSGEKIVFAGVGKTEAEQRRALSEKVFLFNVESEAELLALAQVAKTMGVIAPVALRVNPDLPPKTHAKTDTSVKGVKFGLDIHSVLEVAQKFVKQSNLEICGIHMHLGSPILSVEPYRQGIAKAKTLVAELRKQGHPIKVLNMGGGFGIHYRKKEALPAQAFAEVIVPAVKEMGCKLVLEPGRFIAGNAGVLLGKVIYTKESGGKLFVIQDAAMNDLIRPTLYDSFHRIWPVEPPKGFEVPPEDYECPGEGTLSVDVVGPVCESGDFLAKQRHLPPLNQGDLLAVFSAGAYGMAMSSNYNSRPRAAEIMVSGTTHRVIRRRETCDDLIANEVEYIAK